MMYCVFIVNYVYCLCTGTMWRSLIIDSVVSTFVPTMKYIRHGGQTGEIFDCA